MNHEASTDLVYQVIAEYLGAYDAISWPVTLTEIVRQVPLEGRDVKSLAAATWTALVRDGLAVIDHNENRPVLSRVEEEG